MSSISFTSVVKTLTELGKNYWLTRFVLQRRRPREGSTQLIQVYRECGLDLEPAINAVETGIYTVWQLMSAGKLKVFKSLGNWLKEFRLYQRDEEGRIVKQLDHAMDATRYLIMSGRERMKCKPEAPRTQLVYSFPSQSATNWMQ